jgi:Na+/melibiose symporter-like transporter
MKTSNLALAFLLELCALAAISYWGYRLDAATALRWTIAIAAPLALALVWSQFAAPTARRRLQRAPLLAFKLVVFALAAVLLYSAGQHVLAVVLAAAAVGNLVLSVAWSQDSVVSRASETGHID